MSKFQISFRAFALTFIFISALSTASFAKEENTCYSVQLASIFNKNSIYLNIESYPTECKVISLTNLKAVRCGCYDDKKKAKASLKKLRKQYHGSILVRTYKSRFKNTLDIAGQAKKSSKQKKPIEKEIVTKNRSIKDVPQKSSTQISIKSLLKGAEVNIQGHVDLTAQAYFTRPNNKHKVNLTGSGELEFDISKNDISLIAKIYAQADTYDIQGSSNKNNRSFMRIDELYIKQDFEDDLVMFGKSIRFWGALEVRNITDVFNPTDLRSDIFENDKLGVWHTAYTHYTQTGELSLIGKFTEPERKMASYPYVYYFLPETLSGLPLNYDDSLQKDLGDRPSFFLKYTGSTDTDYPWDYSLIYENGYDSRRYFSYTPSASGTSFDTQENAYSVNKLMSYNTVVLGSTLFKLEALYTDVISNDTISDYYHIGLGVEHTLTQIHEDEDLGLISEYYRYGASESGKYTDLQLFEIFQNDLFLGTRYSFNQGNDASVIAGVIIDLDYDEEVYSIEYESRLEEIFKLKVNYIYINPSNDALTAYNLIGQHQRLSLKLGYYF